MTAHIAGIGWITPLGADLDTVWQRLMNKETPESKTVVNPETGSRHRTLPVPPKLVDSLARNPRLRRSSAISYFAVAAGLAALENAGLKMSPEVAALTALHFATQLIEMGDVDHCVVVGAEESDWILCEAYSQWRFARTPLAEGAAALVLGRRGRFVLHSHPGATFFRQREAAAGLGSVLSVLGKTRSVDLVVRSANGSFVDRAE